MLARTRRQFDVSVDTSWVETKVVVPSDVSITRVRAYVDSPGTQLALQVREAEATTDILAIPLEYELSDSPLDSVEDVHVLPQKISGSLNGTLWIAVKADAACDAYVLLEFES